MTKLNHVYSEIEKSIIPSLTDSVTELNSAIRTSSNIVVPNKFKYSSIIRDLPNFLKSSKDKLTEVKDWLTYSNNVYNGAISSIESNLYGIRYVTIKKRDMIVK